MKHTTPIALDRIDRFAQLLSEGIGVSEAGRKMGMTKGETASTMRNIRVGLGKQAV